MLRGLGLGAAVTAKMAAAMLRELQQVHRDAVQARGEARRVRGGASAVGNWTREHPVLQRSAAGSVSAASVGAASVLEVLDQGRIRVIDGVKDTDDEDEEEEMPPLQRGRARPLHWRSGAMAPVAGASSAEKQGCNSIVFAIEAVGGAGAGDASRPGVDWPSGWQGILKGAIPAGPGGGYYQPMAQQQQQDWLLPVVLGDRRDAEGRVVLQGHPNVLSVLHSFLGSSQLMVPWVQWMNMQPGVLRRKTTWIVTERFPTTLRGAFHMAWEEDGTISGRQAALWLVQVL